jgi:hypothetical protein
MVHTGKIVLSLATAGHFTRHVMFLNQMTCLLSLAAVLYSQQTSIWETTFSLTTIKSATYF